jgi:hypothetical protein
MSGNELSTTQVAERMSVTRQQVGVWCRRGLFPNAREMHTARGLIWMIPESDLKVFVRPKTTGRPPKPKSGTARGQDGRVIVTKKRGGKK